MLSEQWKKSTRSGVDGVGNCVEVKDGGDGILVRDTKANGAGPALTFTRSEWAAFVDGVKLGEFDI